MAKFKPYKLLESQLDSLPIQEGQFILTTDTKKLYSDTAANTRILISPDAITDLSVNGTTITYTRLDGTTGTITTKDTTYSVASITKNGLMSASDKEKLDTIEKGAQANTITGVKGDSESLYRTGNVNITKTNIGLNNVENKSSATIRGELTNSNVTTALGYTPLNSSLKGVNNGLAELDASGKVPASQLPSYVDDVLEYRAKANFPTTGETGKIYVDTSTNKTYRWGGSAYVEISPSIALGTTSSTAFRGDYGQVAYTHAVTNKGSKFDSGLYKIATNAEGHVTDATEVAKSDITALGIPAQDTTYNAATTSTAGLMSPADKTKLDGIAVGAQKNTITGVKGSAETSYRTGNVNITKANIGLGNVENKSSQTILGELTKANVTKALGYIPPQQDTNTTYGLSLVEDTLSLVEGGSTKEITIPVNDTKYTLTQDSTDGHKITLTPSSGAATTITIPDNNTTYDIATTTTNGLMSSSMLTKLNGIAAGAQVNTITGVKGDSETSYRTGNVNITAANIGLGNVENKSSETIRGELTKANVTTALGYTPPTEDTNTTYILTQDANDGHKITLTPSSGNATTITIPDNNTTYTEATTSKAGLISAAMVTKLNGIETGAQKNTITGIKGNAETNYRTGNVNITKDNIGLSNVDNTADANKSVKSAVSATKDSALQQINTTYIKSVSVPGRRITLTKGDGTTTSVENFTTTVNINTANIWVKLGTFNNKTQGEGGEIWLFGGNGQNNSINQNMWAHLLIKKGYQGTAVSTTNYVAATYEIFTPPSCATNYKNVKFKVFCREVGVIDVWVYFPYTYSRSYYYPAGQYDSFTVANTYQTEEPVAGDTYGVLQPTSGGIIASSSNGTSIDNVIKSLSISGKTITYTKGDDTTGTLTTQDTTYTGSNGVSISGTTISNSGVRSISAGDNNGTIKVNTNGISANVAVKGLANAAYKNVDTTIGTASTSANLPTSAAVASFVEGKGYKTTDNNTTYTFATGDANGQIKVTPSGGSAQNVSVKGLGSLAYKSSLTASEVGAITLSLKGAANGIAELDSNGKVPSAQLPSYVDDVLEYNSLNAFPSTGESGKIYLDISTNLTYRWSGSGYVIISSSLALGETSSTAYRGDRGKVAYDHSQTIGNPHQTTKTDIGLENVDNTADADKTVKEAGKVSHFIKIQRNGSLLGQFNGSSEIITNIKVPTKTSEITNDSDFVNSQGTIAVAKKVGTSTVGGSTTPVYINEGTPTPIGYTISKSVPADAVFTDTTYSNATQSKAGLMSATDKTKLDGVSSDADKVEWQQNVNTGVNIANVTINGVKTEIYAPTSAQYKGDMEKSVYDTNNDGIVDEAGKTTGTLTIQQNQVDIDSFDGSVDKTINILIPKNATQDTAGLMSPEDKTKLDNISTSSMPIGSGCDYFGTEAPEGFLFADGSAISRTEYSELFAIIGTIYGAGDGSTTFNLPDKRTRVSVPMNVNDDTFNKLGKTGGEKKHTLTINEMPSHNHGVSIISASNAWGPNYSNGISHKESTKNTGGGQAHNNLQPYLVCNYIIKVN